MLLDFSPALAAVAVNKAHLVFHGAQHAGRQLSLQFGYPATITMENEIQQRLLQRHIQRKAGDLRPCRIQQYPAALAVGLENRLFHRFDYLAITCLTITQRELPILQRGNHAVIAVCHIHHVLGAKYWRLHVILASLGAGHRARQRRQRPCQPVRQRADHQQEDKGTGERYRQIDQQYIGHHACQRSLALHHTHKTQLLLLCNSVQIERRGFHLVHDRRHKTPVITSFTFELRLFGAVWRGGLARLVAIGRTANQQGRTIGLVNFHPCHIRESQRGRCRFGGVLRRSGQQRQRTLPCKVFRYTLTLLQHRLANLA